MITTQSKSDRFTFILSQTCGCGRRAEYEVYEHREGHCEECMKDAIDCSVPVLVRKI